MKKLLTRFESTEVVPEKKDISLEIITGKAELSAFLEKNKSSNEFAFRLYEEEGFVFALSLCYSENEVALIMPSGDITEDDLTAVIKDAVKAKKHMVTTDLKQELKLIGTDALSFEDRELFDDVSIMGYLLQPLSSSYPTEDLAKDYLGFLFPSLKEVLGKMSLKQALLTNTEGGLDYIKNETSSILSLLNPLKEGLKEKEMITLYDEIERPLIFVLSDMEKAGILVSAESLHEYSESLSKRITELESEIYEKAGEEFNINSPKQLGVILFEKLGLPSGKKTKTGYSTSADVLDKLALEYPFVSLILEYRQLTKLKSTYADGLAAFIDADSRIRTTFQQTVTATGRLSSTEPNLQNIPIRMELGRQIRKVFYPKPGAVFIDADYSQIELRCLAHMSGDEALIAAYNSGKDIHAITASEVFNVPFEEVTPLLRRNAKAVNFGIVYGISSFGLGQDLGINRKEAEDYIKKYFITYPRIKAFLDGLVDYAKETGTSKTMYGRIRPIPELSSGNFMQRSFGERVAMNSPIQGPAADIIKIAMISVHDRLLSEGLKSKLLLTVHDELLIEALNEEKDKVSTILKEEMENAAALKVKLEIDMHEGENWFEAK